jgi:Na+-transporting methylmalonyl-CoA/oxaloacetate decarboxylase gamma subunit
MGTTNFATGIVLGITCLGLLLAVLFVLVVLHWWSTTTIGEDERRRALADRPVQVDDVWELLSHSRHAGLYVVVGANVNSEAGPDSWVMVRIAWDASRWVICGPTKYMHRAARRRGDWVLRAASTTEITRPGGTFFDESLVHPSA